MDARAVMFSKCSLLELVGAEPDVGELLIVLEQAGMVIDVEAVALEHAHHVASRYGQQ